MSDLMSAAFTDWRKRGIAAPAANSMIASAFESFTFFATDEKSVVAGSKVCSSTIFAPASGALAFTNEMYSWNWFVVSVTVAQLLAFFFVAYDEIASMQ